MSTGNPNLDRAINELVRTIGKLQSRVANIERGQRATQLDNSSIDAGTVTFTDSSGNPQLTLGMQPDGTYGITAQTGAPTGPPTPDDPQVVSSALGLTVVWDGLIGGATPPANFAGVQVHCSSTPGFTPSPATLQGMMSSAGLFAIPNLVPGTTYYVVLLVQDTAGNTGTASDTITGVAGQLGGSFILPGSVNAADVVMQGSLVASNIYVSYAAQVFLDNPLAWWRMDDETGETVVLDWGPSGFNGTPTSVILGNQNIAVDAMPTAAFTVTAGSKIVSTYQPAAFSALTVEIWVNFNGNAQTTVFPQIFSSSNTSGTNEGFQLYTNGSSGGTPTINLGTGTAWSAYAMGPAIPASGWVHLVMTYDGANVVCYQNGVQVSSTARTGTIAADLTNFVSMNGNSGELYVGLLSNAIIYGTALSAARVQAHYNAAQGAIVADNIAADTITATHILAGTIVAGIVDGTDLQGVRIEGDSFLVYAGTPSLGSLVASISGVSGSDSFGNAFGVGFILGPTGTGQIQLQANINQAFNIQNYLAGTFGAMAQYFTGDSHQVMPSMLGSVIMGSGASAAMASVFHSPIGNATGAAGAAMVLLSANDAGTAPAAIYIGTVSMSADGVTMVFTPIALFTNNAFVQYSGGGSQVIVTETSGSGTISIPGGVTTAKVETWAAGAGSGSAQGFGGGGGGGGEYAAEPALNVSTAGVTYAIGVGGAGAVAGANGSNGGNTTANNNLGTGGGAGNGIVTAHGGIGGQFLGSPSSSAGGSGSTNTTHFNGGAGMGSGNAIGDGGGGGGGSAGPNSAGNNGQLSTGPPGGGGGAAVSGGGRGGNGGYGHPHAGGNLGAAGTAPGGGAGGPGGNGVGGAIIGTAGAGGQVRVTYTTGSIAVGASFNTGSTFTDAFGNSILGGYNLGPGSGAHFGVDGSGNIYIANVNNVANQLSTDPATGNVLKVKNPAGLAGALSFCSPADFTQTSATTTAATVIGKQWTIPANDPMAGAIYEFDLQFVGTQGSTVQSLSVGFALNGTHIANATLASSFAAASANFMGTSKLMLYFDGIGAGGSYWFSITNEAGQGGITAQQMNQGGNQTTHNSISTAAAITVQFDAGWGGTTGAPTMKSVVTAMRRIA